MAVSSSFTIAITMPLRAFTSWIFDMIFSYVLSFGAITTTGIFSSINAIGPCFISAAGYPSAWMYEISFNFSAPSNATGKLYPRPRYKTLLTSFNSSAMASISVVSRNIVSTLSGRSRSAWQIFFPSSGESPLWRAIIRVISDRTTSCDVNAFVDATPISGPA